MSVLFSQSNFVLLSQGFGKLFWNWFVLRRRIVRSWRQEQRTVCGKWIGEVIDPLEVVGHVDVHVLRHGDVDVVTVEKANVTLSGSDSYNHVYTGEHSVHCVHFYESDTDTDDTRYKMNSLTALTHTALHLT